MTAPRSSFVTIVAWITIFFAGMGTLVGLLQALVVFTVMPADEFDRASRDLPPDLPGVLAFLFSHFKAVVLAILAWSALMLATAIGLLRRREWARRLFVLLMLVSAASQLAGLALQGVSMQMMRAQFRAIPDAPDMDLFLLAVMAFSVMLALGFGALYGWIAWKLTRPAVREEFAA